MEESVCKIVTAVDQSDVMEALSAKYDTLNEWWGTRLLTTCFTCLGEAGLPRGGGFFSLQGRK